MLKQLDQSIAISKEILALCGPRVRPAAPLHNPQAATILASVAARGIARVNHSRIPEALATSLHSATEEHFRRSCLLLQEQHEQTDPASLHRLALDLRRTYAKVYARKVADVASSLRPPVILTEKQPFSTDILIYAYDQSQTPTKRERQVLASITGLTVEQVRVWFQNRRQRMKKRAPEVLPRVSLQLEDVVARVRAWNQSAKEKDEYDDGNDSGYYSASESARSAIPLHPRQSVSLTVSATCSRSYPAPYTSRELSTVFECEPPVFSRTAAVHPPSYASTPSVAELAHLMSRLTLRHCRQTPHPSTGSSMSAASPATTIKSTAKGKKTVASANSSSGDIPSRKKATRKDPETGRKVAGRRTASAASAASPASPSSTPSPPALAASSDAIDVSVKPRKRLGPLRRKPAGKALARQASESSVGSTSSSDSSRSTSYSSDFSLASDSSFTSVESAPTAATMECLQPQQPLQFDPLAAFDFTQLFSSQPSDILPQPVADFELPPDLLAGLQMPMDTAALPPPESTDFLALLNDPTIQDLLQSVQDMDVVAPQQTQESFTFNNTLDVGSIDTSGFLDLSASTLPTFDAMFGLDASSFQDTLWNSPGFSLPITV